MENINQLTEKDVTEILSQREELLEGYRKRLEMLSREYEDAGELIEMLQLRSPSNDQEGSKSQEIKGLDDIYMLYEKQKKNYQKDTKKNHTSGIAIGAAAVVIFALLVVFMRKRM